MSDTMSDYLRGLFVLLGSVLVAAGLVLGVIWALSADTAMHKPRVVPTGSPSGQVTVWFEDGQVKRCTEDMPCWNCETMGNKVCGKP